MAEFLIDEAGWVNRCPDYEASLEQNALEVMGQSGTIVGPLERSVHERFELDGLNLRGQDDDGNSVTPWVLVRFRAMALPHEEG